jgi:sugar lactone lactonase YvrE
MALSGVGIFELSTGRLKQLVDLAAVAGPGLHAANDLTIAPDGTAYVTDPLSDALLRIDKRGRASVLVRDPRFHDASIPTSFGLNGIVWHPRGYLLAVKSWGGELFRVTTGAHPQVRQVSTDQPIHNGDGLLLRRDGTLLAVTNPLGPEGISAVRMLRSHNQWTSARTVTLLPWADPAPTTAAATPCGDYVLYGSLDILFGSSLSDRFVIRRVGP